jgi:hypothetical protein
MSPLLILKLMKVGLLWFCIAWRKTNSRLQVKHRWVHTLNFLSFLHISCHG